MKLTASRLAQGDSGRTVLTPAAIEAIHCQRRALKLYGEECEKLTGTVDPKAAEKRSERKFLEHLSTEVADVLERVEGPGGGYSVKASDVAMVGIFSGNVEAKRSYRRSNIIPIVAQEKRGPIVSHATAFFAPRKAVNAISYSEDNGGIETVPLRAMPPKAVRMWVVSLGKNCIADELKGAFAELSRRISKAQENALISEYFEIHLRSTEIGSIDRKNEDGSWLLDDEGARVRKLDEAGRQLYFPHCHLIVEQKHWIAPHLLKTVNAAIAEHFRTYWRDSGPIRELREAIKYCVKPMDMARLAKEDPMELIALHRALFKSRLCEPMGTFRRFRRAIKVNKLRPIVPRSRGGLVRFVESMNAHWKPKERNAGQWEAADFTTAPVESEGDQDQDPAAKLFRNKLKSENVLLAMLPPRALLGDLREPVAIVSGYNGDLNALCQDVRFRVAWSAGCAGWQAARAGHSRANERAREIEPDTRPVIVREPSRKMENPEERIPPGTEFLRFWSPPVGAQ